MKDSWIARWLKFDFWRYLRFRVHRAISMSTMAIMGSRSTASAEANEAFVDYLQAKYELQDPALFASAVERLRAEGIMDETWYRECQHEIREAKRTWLSESSEM